MSEGYNSSIEDALRSDVKILRSQLAAAKIMPGAWVCPKCNFTLQKSTLHTKDGGVSADTSPVNEQCPNDGTLMRPLEWREANETWYAEVTKLRSDLAAAKQRIEELERHLKRVQVLREERKADQQRIESLERSVSAMRDVIEEAVEHLKAWGPAPADALWIKSLPKRLSTASHDYIPVAKLEPVYAKIKDYIDGFSCPQEDVPQVILEVEVDLKALRGPPK